MNSYSIATHLSSVCRSMVVLCAAFALYSVMACSSSTPDVVVLKPPLPKPEPFKSSFNGEEVEYKTMLAYTYGGRGLRIELSTESRTCDDYTSLSRSVAKGERYVSMVVAPLLENDGTESWRLQSFSVKSRSARASGKVEAISTDPKGDVRIKIDVNQAFKADDFMGWEAMTVAMSGELVAKGCGVFARDKDAVSRPQPDLKVTLAGVEMPLQAATLVRNRGLYLKLSTQPQACITDSIGSDLFLSFKIEMDEGEAQVKHLLINGDLTHQNINVGFEDGELPLKLKGGGSLTEGEEILLNLEMAKDVFDGIVLTISGTANVKSCL